MKDQLYQQLSLILNTFTKIPPEEWNKAKRIFQVMNLYKDEFFVRVGEKPIKVGFVLSGVLRLYYATESGNEFVKSFCMEDDFVAAYSALLENKASRLSIQALENTKLLVANYKDYLSLMDSHPCWPIISRKLAENLFIKKEKRESEFLLDSAETRYLQFLKDFPGLEKRVKQYHIASYLGITPVALSRIRTQSGLKQQD